MKRIIPFTLLIITLNVTAQTKVTKGNIIGKWEVVAVKLSNGAYCNIEKDSIFIPKISDKEETGRLLNKYINSFSGQYVFNADNSFNKMHNTTNADKIVDAAMYKIDEAGDITLIIDKKEVAKFKAEYKGEYLMLHSLITDKGKDGKFSIELRKKKYLPSINEQTKLSTASIVGKWKIAYIKAKGMFYNLIKDSLIFPSLIGLSQNTVDEYDNLTAYLREYKKVIFTFDNNSCTIINTGNSMLEKDKVISEEVSDLSGKYEIDDFNKISITNNSRNIKIAGEFANGYIILNLEGEELAYELIKIEN